MPRMCMAPAQFDPALVLTIVKEIRLLSVLCVICLQRANAKIWVLQSHLPYYLRNLLSWLSTALQTRKEVSVMCKKRRTAGAAHCFVMLSLTISALIAAPAAAQSITG